MCQLFIGADADLWESRSKSVRLEGAVTSIRLEHFFWLTLEEIAFRDGMSVGQLVTKLYGEALDAGHNIANFASFLRVCCGRYHALMALGELSSSLDSAIGSVAVPDILERESIRRVKRNARIMSAVPVEEELRIDLVS